ncbi:Receptor-type guanylate cyclase gcy [Seminavis robusta]|uniref:Phosphodiesterase n=1 Tax=Seminavis robusta TaxID=568900 RepID=A0A9N8HMD5_9STRA|nr:Receptor-type guanylate cyclase gcy [Seminavis robusta]|eukprot:Sro898_g217570.1 Receptor-type guanylate cyclase gcy (1085) ;mRNA; f:13832-18555
MMKPNDDDDARSETTLSSVREESRDEKGEIEKKNQKENARVQKWRLAVTAMVLATAAAVTSITYILLDQAETKTFHTAYNQFSQTIGDAALQYHDGLRKSLEILSVTISTGASESADSWPTYHYPEFAPFAKQLLNLSRGEIFSSFNYVPKEERTGFEEWVSYNYQDWIAHDHMRVYGNLDRLDQNTSKFLGTISRSNPENKRERIPEVEKDHYYVRVQSQPPFSAYYPMFLWNMGVLEGADAIHHFKRGQYFVTPFTFLPMMDRNDHKSYHSKDQDGTDNPHSILWLPVHREPGNYSSDMVAGVDLIFAWDASMRFLLPDDVHGIKAVIRNDCDNVCTYRIDGPDALFEDLQDLHDPQYDEYRRDVTLVSYPEGAFEDDSGYHYNNCAYTMSIYPTKDFESMYKTNQPAVVATVVACTFVLVAICFYIYDWFVHDRQTKMVESAAHTNAIVTSLFPGECRDRMLDGGGDGKDGLSSFLSLKDASTSGDTSSKPLADLYLDTTVLYADICGFTAWSSVREPFQVFTLLETVYAGFDSRAKIRRVCKVESVGDCYVAVSGLPVPSRDHSTRMSRYANDIIQLFGAAVKNLETTLGPGTGELALRVGMHSGPVTAGVLRGDRARFQLFGPTVNQASRIEHAGQSGRILVSKQTADLIASTGKGHWLEAREAVDLKGIGTIKTFWVNVSRNKDDEGSTRDYETEASILSSEEMIIDDTARLISWNVETLINLLKVVVARRSATCPKRTPVDLRAAASEGLPLDEVCEIIHLPEPGEKTVTWQQPNDVVIDSAVVDQMREYVSCIAKLYHDNPFHCFDHASHVVMSVNKLLSRITTCDSNYGINSDPLTQLACAFSALIHDVDHNGVSNAVLVEEGTELAAKYMGRSVAEQNSLDLAYSLLEEPRFEELRQAMFVNQEEARRFRALVVNSVMATDIVDKDLKALRNGRWAKAFGEQAFTESPKDAVDRKATIVIEHIIQASDISHTMQHWHIYRKWNERLFEELYVAHINGRSQTNPATFWAKGEIGFFDFYIIPLAKKLQDCGVFGVSSGEFLSYAHANRAEWESKGEAIVEEYVAKFSAKYASCEV